MAQVRLESQSLPVSGDKLSNQQQQQQQQTIIHQESQLTMDTHINEQQPEQQHDEVSTTTNNNHHHLQPTSNEFNNNNNNKPEQDNNLNTGECNIATTTTDNNNEDVPDDGDINSTKQSDVSSFSTAFTISFDDSNTTKKKLNIRDSIRKFAPPKPQTIENPNRIASATLKQNADNSLMSIESAPAELNINKHHTPTRNRKSASSVSSNNSHGHRPNASSNHSSQSIVSDSAAFLIHKMLAGPLDQDTQRTGRKLASQKSHSSSSPSNKHKSRRDKNGQPELVQDEIDFHDDRSDNGTYVVGTDPDAEAARKRIDEIFGVAKTDELKYVKKNESGQVATHTSQSKQHNSRSNRRSGDKPQSGRKNGLSKERQQHIDRLAYRDVNYRSSSVSRSSSSSQNHETSTNGSTNKHNKRHGRNLSCERTSTNNNLTNSSSRSYRRSVSQSSRKSGGNSSGRENNGVSDEDTRSSRSSMSNATKECSDGYDVSQLSTHPNMKFNRAFALRRARLGIETPGVKLNSHSGNSTSQTVQPSQSYIEQLAKLQQNKNVLSPTCSFNREDGGRFSLRVQRGPLPTHLLGTKNRHQTSTPDSSIKQDRSTVDSKQDNKQQRSNLQTYNQNVNVCSSSTQEPCRNSMLSPKSSAARTASNSVNLIQRSSSFDKNNLANLDQQMSPQQRQRYQQQVSSSNHTVPQNANDSRSDCDITSTCGYIRQVYDSSNQMAWSLTEENHKTNHSLQLNSCEPVFYDNEGFSSSNETPATSSTELNNPSLKKPTNIQLGALDSLVISAISSLSQKIRHSVCDILIDQAKKLPVGNETRLVVEEILPQIMIQDNGNKGPATAEEIDRSLYFDLSKTLRNLKKVEQIVDVISMISKQTSSLSSSKSSIQNSPVRTSSASNSNNDTIN